MNQQVLILTPEPPYPLHSGGAYRTASLVHYFSRIADIDLILLSESGQPALLPKGLVRTQHVIPLPANSRGTAARYLRNASRALRGVPPLIDRLSGFEAQIESFTKRTHYSLSLVEHFWCAPYVRQMRACSDSTVLNLHNIESLLHERCATTDAGLQAAGHRRFAAASRKLEAALLPQFDLVLTTSQSDSALAGQLAPGARLAEYSNALPTVAVPRVKEDVNRIVFAGNFEYHPNVDAVKFFVSQIWPLVQQLKPAARVRFVGRGDGFIRHLATGNGFEFSGAVPNALAEIAEAAVVIAPLRAGSGTRIKILEAWSAARPVVATPLAAEGLDARDGDNILLAGSPTQFATAVVDLLANLERRRQMGSSGRATFERSYTWQAAWNTLDQSLKVLRRPAEGGYTV